MYQPSYHEPCYHENHFPTMRIAKPSYEKNEPFCENHQLFYSKNHPLFYFENQQPFYYENHQFFY